MYVITHTGVSIKREMLNAIFPENYCKCQRALFFISILRNKEILIRYLYYEGNSQMRKLCYQNQVPYFSAAYQKLFRHGYLRLNVLFYDTLFN